MIPINSLKQAYAVTYGVHEDVIDCYLKIYGDQLIKDSSNFDNNNILEDTYEVLRQLKIVERYVKIKNLNY